MGVESLVTGQDFSSSFFARVRAKNEEIKHISDKKKIKKQKKHSFIPKKYTKYCVRT